MAIPWIPIVGLAWGIFSGITGKRKQKRAARHARERAEALLLKQSKVEQEMEIEKIRALTELNESKIEAYKASAFQKGSYAGPYFQIVEK